MFELISSVIAEVWRFFERGGVLAWPIFACALAALAIMIERWWAYRRVTRAGAGWFAGVMKKMEGGDAASVREQLAAMAHPSARVLVQVLDKWSAAGRFSRNSLEKAAGHYGGQEIRELERYLPTLATIGNIAPLLGLMGTVLGMVKAFMQIEAMQGKVNASVLAGGIWMALLTTLYGLSVAIPAVIAHNYLSAKVAGIAAEITDQAVMFLDALEESGDKQDPEGGGGRS